MLTLQDSANPARFQAEIRALLTVLDWLISHSSDRL